MLVPQPSPRQNGGLKIIIVASLNSGKKNALRAGGSGESEKKKKRIFRFFFSKKTPLITDPSPKNQPSMGHPQCLALDHSKKVKKKKKKERRFGDYPKKKKI